MEKVKLTQKQAAMIENHRNSFETLIRKHHGKFTPTTIDNLTTQQVVDAYFDGYEEEPGFETGDLVAYEIDGCIRVIGKIVNLTEKKRAKVDDPFYSVPQVVPLSKLRNATPDEFEKRKEGLFWKKNNRRLLELKRGDIILHDGDLLFVDKVNFDDYFHIEASNYHLKTRLSKHHASQCKVICFVKDRKDIN